jgi:hypothetical protein
VKQLYYRIVKSDPPTLLDFTSGAAQGRPLTVATEEALRLHWGISVFATELQAASHARQWPALGHFIAALDISLGAEIHAERTTRRRGHHTLWGSPSALAASVVAVVPVHDIG